MTSKDGDVIEGKVRTLIDGLRSLDLVAWSVRAKEGFVITCGL